MGRCKVKVERQASTLNSAISYSDLDTSRSRHEHMLAPTGIHAKVVHRNGTVHNQSCKAIIQNRLNEQNRVDAPVVLRVVGDLCVLWGSVRVVDQWQRLTRPDDLSAGGDHTQLAHVDLEDGTLGQDA